MPLPLIVSCFSKIQSGCTFLVPAHPGSPGETAVKRARVCVCECAWWINVHFSRKTRQVWLDDGRCTVLPVRPGHEFNFTHLWYDNYQLDSHSVTGPVKSVFRTVFSWHLLKTDSILDDIKLQITITISRCYWPWQAQLAVLSKIKRSNVTL